MQRIKWALITIMLGGTAAWWMGNVFWPEGSIFAIRSAQVQWTGVMAILAMSVAMVLALRPQSIEPWAGGLDKMYRLHKWLGISALVLSVAHWLWAKGPKWAVGFGWLERPQRPPRGAAPEGLQGWLLSLRGLAENLGEWAFYACALLLVLALIKRFPYHWFAKTHRWLAVGYLVLVFHAIVLLRWDNWTQPIGLLLGVSLLAGTASAVWVLLRRVGAGRRVKGTITALAQYPEVGVLETHVRLESGWHGHQAGQFAFVTSSPQEGAHPYTIASDWNPTTREIMFLTKALGDHTRRLPQTLKLGTEVSIEGPYGCFTFNDDAPAQIWVGAGIGITPFVARMKQLARERRAGERPITLIHPTAQASPAALEKLQADAQAAGVTLTIVLDGRDQRLTGERLRQLVPQWAQASVWFCGPTGFAHALRKDLLAQGLPSRRFHQELFDMR